MDKHTEGELKVGDYGKVIPVGGSSDIGCEIEVKGFALSGSGVAKANAARIVDCWNACNGIANPAAIGELVEALDTATSLLWEHCAGLAPRIEPLDAILAKVRGEDQGLPE